MRKDFFAMLRRVCSCCKELFQASPSCDSIMGKTPRRRFWKRRNRIGPPPAPPPTTASPPTPSSPIPQGDSQASSGVTIDLSPAEKIRERDKVILWWTTLLDSIVESVQEAESRCQDTVEFSKVKVVKAVLEIMEDVTVHPDPGSFFRKAMDTITELSKMKPALPQELWLAVLHVAVSGANYLEPGTQNETFQCLQSMLRGLLEEAPLAHNLASILKELHRYSSAKEPQLQALAQEACSCLLEHAASLPGFHLTTLKYPLPKNKK
ncbi:uncharacterized protein LOC128341572 isoform X2 [Hemicordylus capensis]|uniref:uncharacterized protein LOC128341572 isoform X2 n=1 Tax=Hemicordylus capensis TaxID=884348 RepID=UPI00230296A5|nr:uncharacterized protein LOC128341572 isoform X2 [Hemicordylus capensis]